MDIPDELVLHIISSFSRSDLANVSRISQQFHRVSNPLLYRHVTSKNPHGVVGLLLKQTKLASYVENLSVEQPLEGALKELLTGLPNLVRLYLFNSTSSPESIFSAIREHPRLTRLELDAPTWQSADKTIKFGSLNNIKDLTISMGYIHWNLPERVIDPFLPAGLERFRVRTAPDEWQAIFTHLESIVNKSERRTTKLRLIEIHGEPWRKFAEKPKLKSRYDRLVSMGRTKNIEVQIRVPQDCRISLRSLPGPSFREEIINEEGQLWAIYKLAEPLSGL